MSRKGIHPHPPPQITSPLQPLVDEWGISLPQSPRLAVSRPGDVAVSLIEPGSVLDWTSVMHKPLNALRLLALSGSRLPGLPLPTPMITPGGDVPAAVEFGRVAAAPVNTLRQQPHRCQEISVCF